MQELENSYDPESAPKNLDNVIYEKKGHVAYVTINRPEVSNALHTYAYQDLRACWIDIDRDPDIYCGIVTGKGKAFSAGRDVKFLAEHQAKGIRTPHEDRNNDSFRWGGGGQPRNVELSKPLIAAINGYAVGIGLSIALQCQLRVMAEDAWIGDLHTQVGRMGGVHRLYEMIPRSAAAYLTLCNGRFTAQRCYELGIVNEVVPQDRLMAAAEKLAEEICNASPLAVQASVKLYNLAAAFSPEMEMLAKMLDQQTAESLDGAEGPRAFKEKRKPVWKLR